MLGYIVGNVELHDGSVGLHDGVLGYIVEIVGLHCGDCWVR